VDNGLFQPDYGEYGLCEIADRLILLCAPDVAVIDSGCGIGARQEGEMATAKWLERLMSQALRKLLLQQ